MKMLLKYLKIIAKYRKMIFYNVVVFTVIATAISFALPKRYKATAQILPPTEEPDLLGFSTILSGGFSTSGLSRLARTGLFRSATPSDLVASILHSRTIGEQVVVDCDIMQEYKIKKSIEKALKLLKKITKISVTDEGIVQINVEAKKPDLSANIANSYITYVDKFLKESNMTRGKNMRVFVEKRLSTAEVELKQTSDSLKTFQEVHKVVAIDEETKVVIDAYAQLKSELLKREMELAISKDVSAPDNPYVLSIKREIDEFQNKLNEIETGKEPGKGYGVGFAVSFNKLPAVAAEYARRLRDYKVQEEIYALLLQQYEQAKILEARDTPNITVLDYARIPEKKVFPKKATIIITVFMFSFILSCIGCFINEYLITIQKEKPEVFKEWQSIFSFLKIKKR